MPNNAIYLLEFNAYVFTYEGDIYHADARRDGTYRLGTARRLSSPSTVFLAAAIRALGLN